MNDGLPAKYYFSKIHSHTYIYNYLALPFYASQFIYMYREFSRTSILEYIYIYIFVPWICQYINYCNHNIYFLSSLCSSGLEHTIFLYFLINISSYFCNPTKPASRGTPCGVSITAAITITATYLSHFPLLPT